MAVRADLPVPQIYGRIVITAGECVALRRGHPQCAGMRFVAGLAVKLCVRQQTVTGRGPVIERLAFRERYEGAPVVAPHTRAQGKIGDDRRPGRTEAVRPHRLDVLRILELGDLVVTPGFVVALRAHSKIHDLRLRPETGVRRIFWTVAILATDSRHHAEIGLSGGQHRIV